MLAAGPVYHLLSLALNETEKVTHLNLSELGANTHEVHEAFIECCASFSNEPVEGSLPEPWWKGF